MSFGKKNIDMEGEVEFHETDRIAHLNELGFLAVANDYR